MPVQYPNYRYQLHPVFALVVNAPHFIAVKVDKPNIVYQALLKKGFIVRPVEMEGYLRVSVGTKNENKKFLIALKSIL
jgi:histidinol-phosphate aminotransferase